MKRVLILGGPIFQKPVVEKAKSMGLRVAVADIFADAPAADLADEFYQGSIKDYKRMLEIAREFEADAIVSGACDTSVVTAAKLCEKLELPGNSEEAALNSTNKLRMIECFARDGVAHPAFVVAKKDELDDFEPQIPYPFITKPTDSAGGRGVNLVQSDKDLAPALAAASAAGASGDVLVEEYMTGPEVSVEVIVADGVPHVIQVTDKLTSGAPNFFEIGHCQPTSLSPKHREAIARLASTAVLSVGLRNSAAHVEIMLTPEGPKMVELGARLGGDWITSYLIDNSVRGIDMVKCMIKLALGEKIDSFDFQNSGDFVATRFLPAREGLLLEVKGVDKMMLSQGVIHAECHGIAGRQYSKAVDDSARFASVVAKGVSKEEALANCECALSLVEVQMSK